LIDFIQLWVAKIIALIASLIIAFGIVEVVPTPLYELPRRERAFVEDRVQEEGVEEEIIEQDKKIIKKKVEEDRNSTASEKALYPVSFIPIGTLDKKARKSVVNIFCTSRSGGVLSPVSGSGVVIDPRGIILTNAHLAQYFLLKDYLAEDFLKCIIRAGSPAKPAYEAKLLYISPAWIEQNAENIIQQAAKGTGENDFALVLITASAVQGKELPASFIFSEVNAAFADPLKDHPVLLVSYPAGFLGAILIQRDLGLV